MERVCLNSMEQYQQWFMQLPGRNARVSAGVSGKGWSSPGVMWDSQAFTPSPLTLHAHARQVRCCAQTSRREITRHIRCNAALLHRPFHRGGRAILHGLRSRFQNSQLTHIHPAPH